MALRRIVSSCVIAKLPNKAKAVRRAQRSYTTQTTAWSKYFNQVPTQTYKAAVEPDSEWSPAVDAETHELTQQIRVLGNVGKYEEAYKLVSDWQAAGKNVNAHIAGAVRDLMEHERQEKINADPEYTTNIINEQVAKLNSRLKLTTPVLTSLLKTMLENNMEDDVEEMIDAMRADKARPDGAGAIALYELLVRKYEGRSDRALDRLRALKATHDLDPITFDKVVRHISGQKSKFE